MNHFFQNPMKGKLTTAFSACFFALAFFLTSAAVADRKEQAGDYGVCLQACSEEYTFEECHQHSFCGSAIPGKDTVLTSDSIWFSYTFNHLYPFCMEVCLEKKEGASFSNCHNSFPCNNLYHPISSSFHTEIYAFCLTECIDNGDGFSPCNSECKGLQASLREQHIQLRKKAKEDDEAGNETGNSD